MIKEQIFQIVDGANFKQGQTSKEATDTILNLFKAEVDKLTVIDDEEIEKLWLEYEEKYPMQDVAWDGYLLEHYLQHTKKQLLDLMGE